MQARFLRVLCISFKIGSHTSKGVLDYIHSNVWGPVSVSSHSGAQYFVSFIDDYSRKIWIYFMKHKLMCLAYLKSGKHRLRIKLAGK